MATESFKVEVALKHAATTIGEGPHWEEKSGSLLFVDIYSNAAHRFNPLTAKIESSVQTDDTLSLVVPTSREGVYVVSSGRKLCRLNWDTNELTDIHEVAPVGTCDRFNDGKCDAAGRLWAGTMGMEVATAQHCELDKGQLIRLDKGAAETVVKPVSLSNGLAWTADNRTMYYIDSVPRHVYAYTYDLTTGDIANKRVAIDFAQWSDDQAAFPDGMCIDQDGRLWVAGYYSGKVMQFDPETGKLLRSVSVPGKRTTSCCFGGEDFSDLYVTSAVKGYTEEEVRRLDPLAGSLFRVTGLGVKGTAAPSYQID